MTERIKKKLEFFAGRCYLIAMSIVKMQGNCERIKLWKENV